MHNFQRGHTLDASVFINDESLTKIQAGGFLPYDVQATPATVKTD